MSDERLRTDTTERYRLDPPYDSVELGSKRVRIDTVQRRVVTIHASHASGEVHEEWSFLGHQLTKTGVVSGNSTRRARYITNEDDKTALKRRVLLCAADLGAAS